MAEKFPVVIDTITSERILVFGKDASASWLTTANYGLYFIGKAKDTISIGSKIRFIDFPLPKNPKKNKKRVDYENHLKKYYIEWDDPRKIDYLATSKIEILVDTSHKISNYYPLLLTNKSKNPAFIGYGFTIPIIMEAKDSLGKWKPIQEKFIYGCGNGVGTIMLPSEESVLTLAPIFNGNYKTQLRFVFNNNYSKPFSGSINYSQFESKYNYDYKEEYKKEMKKN